jgi:hypothetical protein
MKLVNRNIRRDFADMCIIFFLFLHVFFFICPVLWDLDCYEMGWLYIADAKLTLRCSYIHICAKRTVALGSLKHVGKLK